MNLPLAISETWYLFFVTLSIALAAWMVFIWAVRSGQFKDAEDTAEEMLELDEREEALPDPETDSGRAGTLGGHSTRERSHHQ